MYYFNSSKTKDLYKDMSPFNKDMSSNKNKKIKPSGQCIHLGEYIGKTACTSCWFQKYTKFKTLPITFKDISDLN